MHVFLSKNGRSVIRNRIKKMNEATSSFFDKIKFNIWKIKEETFLRGYIKHLVFGNLVF